MILGFSTQLNGKETFFVEKILSGLSEFFNNRILYNYKVQATFSNEVYNNCKAKLHTLRDDPKDRWKPGMMIDFFINVRTKKMFRFAPRIPVLSIQNVEIKYVDSMVRIFIDGKIFYVSNFSLEHDYKILHFAQNDGFETIEDFFAYFDKDCVLKLIHWTDLKY